MSVSLTVNGQTFQYPEAFNVNWGPSATNWAIAMTSGVIQTSGGAMLGAFRPQKGTSNPTSPTEGDLFYRTDTHKLQYYNGTTWTVL